MQRVFYLTAPLSEEERQHAEEELGIKDDADAKFPKAKEETTPDQIRANFKGELEQVKKAFQKPKSPAQKRPSKRGRKPEKQPTVSAAQYPNKR